MNNYNYKSLNGLLNLNLDNLYVNNQLNTKALPYKDFLTLSGILTDRTIQSQINDTNTNVLLLQIFKNGLQSYINNVNNLLTITTGISYDGQYTTINNQLNINKLDMGYNDGLRSNYSGNIIYGGIENYTNALNIYGKGTSSQNRKINLWDNVQVMGNLIVNGSTFLTSLSGIYITTIFGVKSVTGLPYGSPASVNIDNTIPSNPKLEFGIPLAKNGLDGKDATNPNFSIKNVTSSSSPSVILSGAYPIQELSFGLPQPNFLQGPTTYTSTGLSYITLSGVFPNYFLNSNLYIPPQLTLTIDTVTLSSNVSVSLTNIGSDYKLNFQLPPALSLSIGNGSSSYQSSQSVYVSIVTNYLLSICTFEV